MENKPIIEQQGNYKGYSYIVLFQPLGFRCGYVQIPFWHKLYECDYEECGITCHGGLTYGDHRLLDQYFPHVYWIGFDCAHGCDLADIQSVEKYYGEGSAAWINPIVNKENDDFVQVRDLDYCITQCRNIIEQLKDME